MTQASTRFPTFADYLACTDEQEGFYELIDGELVELPPESEPNDAIAHFLFLALVQLGVPFRLIKPHSCEIQVPVLQKGDAANRYPDLVVLREEHLALTQTRLTVTLMMPPPVLVVEVVSPGKTNRLRDYDRKRAQYEQVGIPEFWLIDPSAGMITLLSLEQTMYREIGVFRGADLLQSPTFPTLHLTAAQLLSAG